MGAKNALQKGFRKKHEKVAKHESKNESILDEKTFESVVRVTNFKVFAISEKNRKIDAKMAPKIIKKSTKIDPWGAQGRFIH